LTGPAMVGLAHMAFQEVKAAFRERMRDRPDGPEWELTAEDCHFVRNNFQYEKFDEFTYPSADLQLEARSLEAIDRGADGPTATGAMRSLLGGGDIGGRPLALPAPIEAALPSRDELQRTMTAQAGVLRSAVSLEGAAEAWIAGNG